MQTDYVRIIAENCYKLVSKDELLELIGAKSKEVGKIYPQRDSGHGYDNNKYSFEIVTPEFFTIDIIIDHKFNICPEVDEVPTELLWEKYYVSNKTFKWLGEKYGS